MKTSEDKFQVNEQGMVLEDLTGAAPEYGAVRESLVQDRRSGRDRRRKVSFARILFRGPNRRGPERRTSIERRLDWVKIDKWSSACIDHLKIGKFLKQTDYTHS
jgi:hypothetical protein